MRLPMEFDSRICGNLTEATSREWLETNGIGGFASSTIVNLNTRRYHGLLVAATEPPVGRAVLVSKFEETLIFDGQRYELSANQYAGAVHPQGYRYLESFRLDPFPVFTYRAGNVEIQKSVFLVQGENTVVIQYEMRGGEEDRSCGLEVRPLIAFRDFHNTTHANDALRRAAETGTGFAAVTPYPGMPCLYFAHSAESIDCTGYWFYNFQYERERERGLDDREDLYSPFLLRFRISEGVRATVIASTMRHRSTEAGVLEIAERERRRKIAENARHDAQEGDVFASLLNKAADQFLVARGEHKSVMAGYHWFGDWGRDTMISLPGLTLVTGRHQDARDILRAYTAVIDQGMLPNRFPEAGETPEYNSVDAALWMFHAVHEFLRYTGDYDFVRTELYGRLADAIGWHERGTRHGIRLDSDGLLRAGVPGQQLTWMDVKIGDWVVTERAGKPVEIQALWYNAVRVMEQLSGAFGDSARSRRYQSMAERTRASFVERFWNESSGCLYDVIADSGPDASIRPNQIFAVSLPYPLLEGERAMRVVEVVEWELLTPYGLRTRARSDPKYRGRYAGDPVSRDSAYHQGTVWPWLLGPFLTAYVNVHGDTPETRHRIDGFLDPMREHLWQAGLGQISEVFDGDPPHHPGGCIAQAWSVAEVLRAYQENVQHNRPA